MIITKTPLRISFIGGGTDFEDFFKKTEGRVLSTSIDKYIYVVVRKQGIIHDFKYRINWSKTEFKNDINTIEHPIVREAFKLLNINFPIEVSTFSDIPSNTGLGSSSAFAVGLVNALLNLLKIKTTKKKITDLAIKIELTILKRNIGIQDHYASAYGGLNKLIFHTNGKTSIDKLKISKLKKRIFFKNLLIFFTGTTRDASKILSYQKKSIQSKNNILKQMVKLVDTASMNCLTGDFDKFAINLNDNWNLKKQLSPYISNRRINFYLNKGLRSGASGGKLLGAGGGGFLCFYVEKKFHKSVIKSLNNLIYIPINEDNDGTQLLELKSFKSHDKKKL